MNSFTWPVYDSTLVALEDEARPGELGQTDQTGVENTLSLSPFES